MTAEGLMTLYNILYVLSYCGRGFLESFLFLSFYGLISYFMTKMKRGKIFLVLCLNVSFISFSFTYTGFDDVSVAQTVI